MSAPCVLVADIGGTNARFAIARLASAGGIELSDHLAFATADYPSIEHVLRVYRSTTGCSLDKASIAVAGPVGETQTRFANADWIVDRVSVAHALDLVVGCVSIQNDFSALASGLDFLADADLHPLKAGSADKTAPVLVLGPGTGLGQALVVKVDGCPTVVATEGGHVAFAPQSELEWRVHSFIARQHRRVSAERVLSGQGLEAIYRALAENEHDATPLSSAAEITAVAGAYPLSLAATALRLFCAILGRVAGDAVLSTGAFGGVMIGGGIAPQILSFLKKGEFVECFEDKGRMSHLVRRVPVSVVLNQHAALYGAAATFLRDV